jgi:hypothetical protein
VERGPEFEISSSANEKGDEEREVERKRKIKARENEVDEEGRWNIGRERE